MTDPAGMERGERYVFQGRHDLRQGSFIMFAEFHVYLQSRTLKGDPLL